MDKYKVVEQSIIKKYRKEIYSKFTKAVRDYELINEGDKIMACISGGKDSFLNAKCLQELKNHGNKKFDLVFVCMNPGYTDKNKKLILKNAKTLNIPLIMFDADIFNYTNSLDSKISCYMCARMRRGYLYSKAQELGCNKIALGHHFDDVVETILLSMFYAGEYKTMMPKLHSDNFEGIELIRPLYLVKEKDIISWKEYNELEFLNCACKFTLDNSINESTSKRKEIKELLNNLRKVNKDIDHNIFKALDNVNLNCVLGYVKGKEKHSFLDEYGDIYE